MTPAADGAGEGRPGRARVGGNVAWLVAEKVFQLGTTFAVSVWFVRYAGPTAYGAYAYALSLATLFASLATLGTDAVVVRDLARDPGAAGEILGSALAIRGAAGALGWVAAVACVRLVRGDALSIALVDVLGAGALAAGLGVFDLWFQARLEARPASLGRIAVSLLTLAARILLLAVAAPLVAFAWVQVLGAAASALAVFALHRWRAGGAVRPAVRAGRIAHLLGESWPLLVSGLAVTVYLRIDQIMLGQLAGDHATGVYATASTLSEVWYFVPVAVGTTALPILSRRAAQESAALLQTLYDAMVALSLAIAVPVSLAAAPLVRLLFGEAYAAASGILRVHVWSLVFVALGTARSRFLVAEGLTRFAMLATIAGALLNVLLNLVLIPRWAGLGAAWATLISYAVAGWLTGILHPRVRGEFRRMTLALAVPLRPGTLLRALRGGPPAPA